MSTGPRGLALIKKWEGLRLAPYKDSAGLWTVGYGHLVKEGEHFTRIGGEEAEELLAFDLLEAERAVEALTQQTRKSEYDALVSFTFNLGKRHLAESTLLKLHNAGERLEAACQVQTWRLVARKPNRGLLRRRLEEAALYLEDA
jgi:lysozyme